MGDRGAKWGGGSAKCPRFELTMPVKLQGKVGATPMRFAIGSKTPFPLND